MMRPGYYYRHESAPDIFIYARSVLASEPGVALIKCDIYSRLYRCYYETVTFPLPKDKQYLWGLYAPETYR